MSTVIVRFTSSKQLAWLRVHYPAYHITRDEPGQPELTAKKQTTRGVVIVNALDGGAMAASLQDRELRTGPQARTPH